MAFPAPRLAVSQVLIHLLRNAAQAAVADRPLRIDVAVRVNSAGVRIQVTDNGRGLSPERCRRLFEPFPGNDGTSAGNGLGLFLVGQLVRSCGGSVQVESELGRGTTMTVLLPQT